MPSGIVLYAINTARERSQFLIPARRGNNTPATNSKRTWLSCHKHLVIFLQVQRHYTPERMQKAYLIPARQEDYVRAVRA